MIALGLDYGTTNSLIAIYQHEMSSKNIRRVHKPSFAYDDGEYIRSPKRLLNNLQDNRLENVMSCINSCIQALLSDLRCKMSEHEHENINLAFTVPNAFKDNQCDVLKMSILQSLNDNFNKFDPKSIDLIPEPVAAALYYAHCLKMSQGQIRGKKYIIVSDMGGGTTDLAVVRMEMKGQDLHFKVVATEHDSYLGGDDVDMLIAEYLTASYALTNVDEKNVLSAAQHLKKKLSFNQARGIGNYAESLLLLDGGCYCRDGRELEMVLDSNKLSELLSTPSRRHPSGFLRTYTTLLEKLRTDFIRYLQKEGYKSTDMENVFKNNVVLLPVGGSSRLKFIRESFSDAFRSVPVFNLKTEVCVEGNAEALYDSVVRGAAIYSAYRSGIVSDLCKKIVIENRTYHSITVRYSSDKVYTCVQKSMPDDKYTSVFNPKLLSSDGKTFTIGTLEFYQGGYGNIMDKDCVRLTSVSIDDLIYTHGKQRDQIRIMLALNVVNGRLDSGSVVVPNGNKDGSDYEKVLELRRL